MVSPIAELEQMWQITAPFPWQVIALIMVGVSFGLVAIVYMFGRMFDSDKLKKWAYGELLTTLATLIIIAIFVVFITIISNMVYSLSMEMTRINYPAYYVELQKQLSAKGVTEDVIHFLPAQNYVNGVEKCVRQLYIINLCTAHIVEPVGNAQGVKSNTVAIPILLIRNAVRTFALTTTYLSYATYIQKNMLLFVQQVALTVFLPIGIVLRTFPMSRGAGNLFIALGLGAYFVYPLSYSVMLMVSSPPAQFESKCGISTTSETLSDVGNCARALSQTAVFSSAMNWKGILSLFTPDPGTMVKKMLSLSSFWTLTAGAGVIGGSAWAFIEQSKPLIIEAVTYAVVFPFVIMAITYTFIKSFSTFLGADSQDLVQGLFRII
jgi:hypothetical protein